MRYSFPLSALALALSQLLLTVPARAAIFPDVPDGHLYQVSIETLVGIKVINGNPDGTFMPDKAVNRAEMLAMLYRANNKTPDASKRGCFPDVQPGSWYELYVCDAAAHGYVKGYPDGTFKPNKELNHVEALKMIEAVFGMGVPDSITSADASLIAYVDVDLKQWYGTYLVLAIKKGIIPVAGWEATHFFPESASKRGETAAMIAHALFGPDRTSSASSTSVTQSSSSVKNTATSSHSANSNAAAQPKTFDVSVPGSFSGNFNKKNSSVYRFTLTSSMMLAADAKLGGAFTDGMITCRLYKIESNGFSNEYYLGYQETGMCHLRTKIAPGNYQLELQPSAADASYMLDIKSAIGDNNDGFSEAKTLLPTQPRSDQLDAGDLADWYKFTLTLDTQLALTFVNDGSAQCVVYPLADVDIFGFTDPTCDKAQLFPKGSYMISVARKNGHQEKTIYTLQLKK